MSTDAYDEREERITRQRRDVAAMVARGEGEAVPVLAGGKIRWLSVHPLALTVPAMTGDELDALYNDIALHGIREPIWRYEGKILDGRHRLAVAYLTEQPIEIRDFKGTVAEARDLVVSTNLRRRHLTPPQVATAVLALFAAEAKASAAAAEAARTGFSAPPAASSPPVTRRTTDDWAGEASRRSGGVTSAPTLRRMDEARVLAAPRTMARIGSGEIRTTAQAVREAATERGVPVPPPVPMGVISYVTAAKHSLRRALEDVTVNGGAGSATDRMLEHITQIRVYCTQIEARCGRTPPS